MAKKLTSKELIVKHCDIIKSKSNKGSTIVFAGREFRMNRVFDELPDEDFDKILADKELGMGRFIVKMEKAGTVKAEKKAARTPDPKPCECGCGTMAKPGSRYLPGHDAKHKSALIKDAKAGKKTAATELAKRGWTKFLEKSIASDKTRAD